jgi:hypothetical protein
MRSSPSYYVTAQGRRVAKAAQKQRRIPETPVRALGKRTRNAPTAHSRSHYRVHALPLAKLIMRHSSRFFYVFASRSPPVRERALSLLISKEARRACALFQIEFVPQERKHCATRAQASLLITRVNI